MVVEGRFGGEDGVPARCFARLDLESTCNGFNSRDASKALVGDFSEAAAAARRLVLPGTLFPTTIC